MDCAWLGQQDQGRWEVVIDLERKKLRGTNQAEKEKTNQLAEQEKSEGIGEREAGILSGNKRKVSTSFSNVGKPATAPTAVLTSQTAARSTATAKKAPSAPSAAPGRSFAVVVPTPARQHRKPPGKDLPLAAEIDLSPLRDGFIANVPLIVRDKGHSRIKNTLFSGNDKADDEEADDEDKNRSTASEHEDIGYTPSGSEYQPESEAESIVFDLTKEGAKAVLLPPQVPAPAPSKETAAEKAKGKVKGKGKARSAPRRKGERKGR